MQAWLSWQAANGRFVVTAKRSAILVALLALAPSGPSRAQTGDIRTELMHCLTFTGAVERLSCYDRLARGAASGGLGAPPAPAAALPNRPAVSAPPPPRELGQEELRGAAPPAATQDRLSAEILNFQKDQAGRFTVTLNNGQVWEQVAGDTTAAQYHPGRTRNVTISRGTLGSYDL